MSGLGIGIAVQDYATEPLLRVRGALQRGDVRRVMGRQVANDLRAYFVELDRDKANALGGTRTHFWADVRRSVQSPQLVGDDGVQVAINHVGFAQRLFGGDIKAKDGGWLTIPARSEAHGKRAGEFNDLHFVYFRADLAALVQNTQTSLGGRVHGSATERGRTKGETIGGGVFYWLKPEVHQEPDDTVLPKSETLAQNAAKAAGEYVQSLAEGAN